MPNRRQFLATAATGLVLPLVGTHPSPARAGMPPDSVPAPSDFELTLQPERVFKRTADQDRLRQEYWLFVLVLTASEARKPALEQLVVGYASRGEVRRVNTYSGAALAALDLMPQVAAAPGKSRFPVAAFQVADAMPVALAIDSARCELAWRDGRGATVRVQREVPLGMYAQRTQLRFPFVGHGMITQGGAWNDGHRNRSGMFAIDAIGLTDGYAMMVGTGDAPEATAGWGRSVIAPAAGRVVVARGDRPDQPMTGVADPHYFTAEFPQGGDPGNHCVIDHGNGEFSMLAHFRQGSLRVRVGDRIEQGQPLAQLGNSGDTNAPHVHHQLQDGPDWMTADALPHAYVNGPERQHDRGTIFEAR